MVSEIAHRSNSHQFVALLLCSASTSLLIGMFLVWRSRVVLAGLASLLCWVMLGVASVCIEEQPRRVDHILSLLDAGKINIKSPLRYYGRLADEPAKLPWGASYDIELSGVAREVVFEISCFVACAESPTVTTSRRAEMPNQNQNNQQ